MRRIALATAGVAMFTGLSIASAASVTPTVVNGNPMCEDLAPGTVSVKADPPKSGTYTNGSLSVQLTVDGANHTVDFTSNTPLEYVIVKGGDVANVYHYVPSASSDTDLTTPTNPNNGQPYGLSHVDLCVGTSAQPSPSATPVPSTTPVASVTPVASPGGGSPPPVTTTVPPPQQSAAPGVATGSPTPTNTTPPGGGVKGVVKQSGRANLAVRNRCGEKFSTVAVTGRQIKRIVFKVDGRRVATRKGAKRVVYRIRMSRLDTGIHKVQAVVTFTKASKTRSKTLRAIVNRCSRQAVLPQFTG